MSNSQFVPGNTGMITRGFAFPVLAINDFLALPRLSCSSSAKCGRASCFSVELTGGNTTESFSSHAFSISSSGMFAP